MSPGGDGPNQQFDDIGSAMRALGVIQPQNSDGTVGPRTHRVHQTLVPKGRFKVGQNARRPAAPVKKARRPVRQVEYEPPVDDLPIDDFPPEDEPELGEQEADLFDPDVTLEITVPLSRLQGVVNALTNG